MFLQIALLLVAVAFYLRYKYNHLYELHSTIPSPKKLFLLHNVLQFWNVGLEDVFRKTERWQNDLGDVFHFTLFPLDAGTFIVSDVKVAEALSLHKPDRSGSKNYQALSRWIGKGFFVSPAKQLKSRMKPFGNVTQPKFYAEVLLSEGQ